MYDKNEICERIRSLYPELGQCDIDLKVEFDYQKNSWVVYLNKDNYTIKHFLSDDDVDVCLLGKHCIGLGIDIAQFR